jgi:hypothetical protein
MFPRRTFFGVIGLNCLPRVGQLMTKRMFLLRDHASSKRSQKKNSEIFGPDFFGNFSRKQSNFQNICALWNLT